MKLSECIRAHGVPHFPDPDPKGEYQFGIDVSPAVWKKATDACKDLTPPGTFSGRRSPKQQSDSLRFAACIRANGVKDFPDPVNGDPVIDTTKIPSTNAPGGMTILNGAMSEVQLSLEAGSGRPAVRRKALATAGAVAVAAIIGGVVVLSAADDTPAAAQTTSANTAPVQKGKLSAAVSQDGTLTYRAQPDGSPFSAINQAHGVYTELPESGDKVGCGDVLYRVDDKPVLLLCGPVPAYRALNVGDKGRDVRQLNRNLHLRGNAFTTETETALAALQRRRGVHANGALALGDAVFLPEAVRIAKVTAGLGGSAQPGAPALNATSEALHVQVNLDPSDQGQVKRGDRAQITLPGNTAVAGKVDGFGRVAESPAEQGSTAADATIPTYISLDDPGQARGLDKAPVGVVITTAGVASALSVPVTALVGKSGGGFAVEVVRAGGRRDLVAVQLGLFDTADGRVQVEGDLREGDRVVVPSL